jgi:hypothetical protein
LQLAIDFGCAFALQLHRWLPEDFRLAFPVGLAVSSLSVSPAGSAFRPALWALHIRHPHFHRRRRLVLRTHVADTFRFRLHPYRCGLTVCLRLAYGNLSVRFRSVATASRAFSIPSVSLPAGRTFPSWSYVYGHYRNLASSIVSFAFGIGCHLSLRFSSFSAYGSSYACGLRSISRPQSSVLCARENHFQPWFSWIPLDSRFAACDLLRYRFLSTKRLRAHTSSLASLLITAFAVLRNYHCLTDAFRIAFTSCATLTLASLFDTFRLSHTLRLLPATLRLADTFRISDGYGSIFDFRL